MATISIRRRWLGTVALLCILALLLPSSALASPANQDGGPWWEYKPEPNEAPLSDGGILYSQIPQKLRELETTSNRVRVEVIGQSAGGRNLFLATVSAPEAFGRLGQYQAIRQTMLKDPEKAQEMIEKFGDFKVPVFINGSIHGGEVTGVDAIMRLLDKLAYDDSPEVQAILENMVLLFNVVQNPDGRVAGTRSNSNGFDLNRDFITQSQPETRATAKILTDWNPMVVLDLHGFVNPMLIEPCTPPHNPNYEYDLYIKWAYDQALAMEAELFKQTGFSAQIPFRDDREGWDDWPPIFTPMYAMYHGAYGHTLETPYRDERGVDAHYAAVWGALNFVVQNRQAMINDQVEIFKRGFLASLQVPIPQDILDENQWNQFPELTLMDFPTAYVIPASAPLQQNPHQAARLVDFLIANDVEVEQASQEFVANGVSYPAGTYVVWLQQPKRGLANTILWRGWDISYVPGLDMYDISGWSHSLIWEVTRAIVDDDAWTAATHPVNNADAVQGSRQNGKAAAYAYLPTSNQAVKATNALLARGTAVKRTEGGFSDGGRTFGAGTFVVTGDASLGNELANSYGLQVFALKAMPAQLVALRLPKIAVTADEGARFELTQLGFPYTVVSRTDLQNGVLVSGQYDVWINSAQTWGNLGTGQGSFKTWVNAGGDYIGFGRTGLPLPASGGLLTFTSAAGTGNDNGILNVSYDGADPVAAQYPAESYGFVYGPAWLTSWGPNVDVVASAGAGDFFVAGYWANWKTSSAAGNPVVARGKYGAGDVTVMGLNPTFRAHPELTFRLLANAIYTGLD